ncbi:MAG: hypothetical protein QJR02_02050 [Sinobacteraceae bacterium]|nr:hypothetical protein [Nevskiaceae bacterium]
MKATQSRPSREELEELWSVMRRCRVPANLAIPFLLRLVGVTATDVAKAAGIDRTYLYAKLSDREVPDLGIRIPIYRRLGFDPWPAKSDAEESAA